VATEDGLGVLEKLIEKHPGDDPRWKRVVLRLLP
jgi:hypothetical protein